MNQLYFGDNLDILINLYKQNPTGFIDLIYIDPPFNSKRNYNILFESVDLKNTVAQREAFADTWTNVNYLDELSEIKDLHYQLYRFIENLEFVGISTGAISYITTMSIRIFYMHRLLKSTGCFFLHCDPVMSHYLKIVCDIIFEERNYRNEIVWHYGQRTDTYKLHFSRKHDIILLYGKTAKATLVNTNSAWDREEFIKKRHDIKTEKGGRQFIWTDGGKGKERYKRYVEDVLKEGKPLDDVWELPILNSAAKERLGYPTQKPISLMERIITASSNEGDLVADFFCGCGTTIAAAHKLKRKWLGVDISHLAIKLISKRLIDNYGSDVIKSFETHGFPKDKDSAKELASLKGGRLEFEEWIIEVMLHGVLNQQRNKPGYDGYITLSFHDKKRVGFIEVKSGSTSLSDLSHFIKTVEDNKVEFGLFVCFEQYATKGMRIAAKQAGYFDQDNFQKKHDKIQIITVEQLLKNEKPNLPESSKTTFKTAARSTLEKDSQIKFEM